MHEFGLDASLFEIEQAESERQLLNDPQLQAVPANVNGLILRAQGQFGQAAQEFAALNSAPTADADTHFAESLRLFELGDARLEAAKTRALWDTILCERGAE